MAKERALTLEALRVMDAIDRRGSFAAAADELGRVPSALSYTMQKLEEELDVVLSRNQQKNALVSETIKANQLWSEVLDNAAFEAEQMGKSLTVN
ncbi:LysR family transcriptional regulator, partial [Escherichia coli]|uniref:LysR family transcriptional regulator n=1 Tax=Escherichia coli TaxID=562 RepID=UPI002AFB0E98|nr:LysR family transcriptional regulator [Escherichia coli]